MATIRAGDQPTVDIVVVNFNGKEHLAPCFDSLQSLDYPAERYRIVCVDNASSDGSVEYIRQQYPGVALLESETNLGFAAACNLGARASGADCVAFVNNDARVDAGWLTALAGAVSGGDPDLVCAAAKMLDWEGEHIDFVEGRLNFHGFARQAFWRLPASPGRFDAAKETLFPCGGAMLVRRDVFVDVGGFDDDYFMFFEDVDLGWRLWIMGYKVAYVPAAVTYHRHHASAATMPDARRQLLYERNALQTVIKNYDDANLGRVLPAALFLAVRRATDAVQADRGGPDELDAAAWHALDAADPVPAVGLAPLAPLVALRAVSEQLPRLMAKRAAVQGRRRRSDEDIFPLFGQPLRSYPVAPDLVQAYGEDHANLAHAFGLDRMFGSVKTRVLILTSVGLPSRGAHPTTEGLRAEALGRGLTAAGHEVRYAEPRRVFDDRQVKDAGGTAPPADTIFWDDQSVDHEVMLISPDVIVATHWRVLAFARACIFRPVVLDANRSEPALDAVSAAASDVIRARDYLANVDVITAPDAESSKAFRQWLARHAGVEIGEERCLVVPADLGTNGLEGGIGPLDDYCQRFVTYASKLSLGAPRPRPPTPLRQLPARALDVIKYGGLGAARRSAAQYLRWLTTR